MLCVDAVGYGMVPRFLRRREFRVAFLALSQSARLLVFGLRQQAQYVCSFSSRLHFGLSSHHRTMNKERECE